MIVATIVLAVLQDIYLDIPYNKYPIVHTVGRIVQHALFVVCMNILTIRIVVDLIRDFISYLVNSEESDPATCKNGQDEVRG